MPISYWENKVKCVVNDDCRSDTALTEEQPELWSVSLKLAPGRYPLVFSVDGKPALSDR